MAAALAIGQLRDRRLGTEFLSLIEEIPTTGLDADAQDNLCLARALFLYEAGQSQAAFLEASLGLEQMRLRGAANTTAAQLQTGLGVTASLQGRYEESARHYERALQMANMLDNDSLASRICANLALTYGRLGRFEDQLRCAESAPEVAGGAIFRDIQLTYSKAFVHGMNGRIAKARAAIADLEARLQPDLSKSFKQRWLLWKADALMVSGLKTEAIDTAKAAVCENNIRLETSTFAGAFARWVAIVCAGGELEARARDVLRDLEEHLEEYDAIDQAEILCAIAHFDRAEAFKYRSKIAEKLRLLPSCTVMHLRSLGLAIEV
jgi:tetratricopeptide (TPR) repeat protein